MQRFIVVLLSLLSMPGAFAERPDVPYQLAGVTRVEAEDVVRLILRQPELVVIDSRKQEAYAKGHIEGAINIHDAAMTPQRLSRHAAEHDTPLLFYCQGVRCLRSSNAASKARQWGYRNVYWFRAGWAEWRNQGLPVER